MKLFLNKYKTTNILPMLVVLLSIVVYYFFAYNIQRTQFVNVFISYAFLFASFLMLYKSKLSTKHLIYIGILFRIVFIIASPNLSNDYYRFLWDGRALFNQINPYLILPENNPNLIGDGLNLYKGMGSMNGSHYTCYPPLNQFAFTIPAIFSDQNLLVSTVVMRITLILSDLVTLFFSIKLLQLFNLPKRKILLYFINPFIIIELTGNLHYEGMMIAFFSAALYYLFKSKKHFSAILFGCAVSIKLIPLIFLPLFYKKLGFKNLILYGTIVLLTNIILFIPFLSSELYTNFMSSIELYFQNFEFNASIYYIIREIGFHIKGYNIIKTVGKITPIIIFTTTLLVSFYKQNQKKEVLIATSLFVITFYYSLSSIVHPWYIAIPLFLSVFSTYRFPVIWSFAIILSYSAYIHSDYKENLFLVALEYICVFGYLVYEYCLNTKKAITNRV